jgi:transcriptional regulator with XRE-family HTH domain
MSRIREYREKNNFTQAYIAEKLGVGANAVSQWETGSRSPSVRNLRMLADVFKCSVDDLLKQKCDDSNNEEEVL